MVFTPMIISKCSSVRMPLASSAFLAVMVRYRVLLAVGATVSALRLFLFFFFLLRLGGFPLFWCSTMRLLLRISCVGMSSGGLSLSLSLFQPVRASILLSSLSQSTGSSSFADLFWIMMIANVSCLVVVLPPVSHDVGSVMGSVPGANLYSV
jgi:hypothetical protein